MDPLIEDRIRDQIRQNPILIYMKGTPEMPMCGFSNAVVRTFDQFGYAYGSVNVLEDADVRQGIKAFSNWPTIPQVYIQGEFVGGCDIILEMHQRGELEPLVKQAMAQSLA
ncbi:MAG: Grx4 family monothiol glutaredoxin [Synechococcaceae cyanobacterium RM1_1_27]|nr:Grx4 family monothiol glutaredoxin [Synechococcaceae cyanobacterium SM2_3_2]NJO85660.1 Grx4 family monothiol glutaredoxin [Synechococcaceae cyanobacterium RM1_1_27]